MIAGKATYKPKYWWLNPPDWTFARFLVQQFYPFSVGKLGAAEFLSAYWYHIGKWQSMQIGRSDPNADDIARDKLYRMLYSRNPI